MSFFSNLPQHKKEQFWELYNEVYRGWNKKYKNGTKPEGVTDEHWNSVVAMLKPQKPNE